MSDSDEVSVPATSANLNLLQRNREELTPDAEKIVIVMVGLPGRGKSFIASKIISFLTWKGFQTQMFNVGNTRRKHLGSNQTADWFSTENANGMSKREQLAERTLKDMLEWLGKGGEVAVFDATNSTKQRRSKVIQMCTSVDFQVRVVFVESICTDHKVLKDNLRDKVTRSPDYRGMDKELAAADFLKRIQEYERVYEEVDDDSQSYIKLFNLQSKVHANQIYGRLCQSLLPYIMSIHVGQRPIWLTRAGHCGEVRVDPHTQLRSDNRSVIASRGARLSDSGHCFSRALADFIFRRCLAMRRRKVASKKRRGCSVCGSGSGGASTSTSTSGSLVPAAAAGAAAAAAAAGEGEGGRSPCVCESCDSPKSGGSGGGGGSGKEAWASSRVSLGGRLRTSSTGSLGGTGGDNGGGGGAGGGDGIQQVLAMTSTLPRAVETAEYVRNASGFKEYSMLNPLDKGDAYGLTMEEFEQRMPEDFARWQADPLHARFPGGESYYDVIRRLEPLLLEIEQQTQPVLIVSHISCIQMLYSYFMRCPISECHNLSVPFHSVIELTPSRSDWAVNVINLKGDFSGHVEAKMPPAPPTSPSVDLSPRSSTKGGEASRRKTPTAAVAAAEAAAAAAEVTADAEASSSPASPGRLAAAEVAAAAAAAASSVNGENASCMAVAASFRSPSPLNPSSVDPRGAFRQAFGGRGGGADGTSGHFSRQDRRESMCLPPVEEDRSDDVPPPSGGGGVEPNK